MKLINAPVVIATLLTLAGCGANEGSEKAGSGNDAVAAQPGEFGTVEGSFDAAGEGQVNSTGGNGN